MVDLTCGNVDHFHFGGGWFSIKGQANHPIFGPLEGVYAYAGSLYTYAFFVLVIFGCFLFVFL